MSGMTAIFTAPGAVPVRVSESATWPFTGTRQSPEGDESSHPRFCLTGLGHRQGIPTFDASEREWVSRRLLTGFHGQTRLVSSTSDVRKTGMWLPS